jgi:hypothetical protein
MAGTKRVDDSVLDGAFAVITDACDLLNVTTEGADTYSKASQELGTGDGQMLASSNTPTFTGPAPDVSGRKLTVDEEPGITIEQNGTPVEVHLLDSVGEVDLYNTTCTGADLVTGNTVTVQAWKINIPDPT